MIGKFGHFEKRPDRALRDHSMKKFAIAMVVLLLCGCDKPAFTMGQFEKFAYEGCVKEGRYSNAICACNAANLDRSLNAEEKHQYQQAALGDTQATSAMMGILDKLKGALQSCAK